jgi:hypothetical protein
MLRITVLGALAAVALVTAAQAGSITLTGPTTKAGTYSPSDLAAIGTANPSLVVTNGGLTGISLWGLLGGAAASSSTSPVYGAITTSTPPGHNGKNAILRYFVVGVGTDGSQSAVSGGQIDPSFGATGIPVFVAYQNAGGPPLTTPQFVVPGGPTGSTISSLASLQLLAFPALPNGAGGESMTVTLSGNVTNPGAYTLTMLENNFTPVQQTVSGDTYTGIPLLTFISTTSANINTQIVVGQGTDGYEVVYSLSELANLNNILAYAATGTDFPGDGVARTILPADNLHGRFISNLLVLEVTNWTVVRTTDTHDFNGDGMSDIAWRDTTADSTSGALAIWEMNGTQVLNPSTLSVTSVAYPLWTIIGLGDFNGDSNADFLWRDSAGNLAIWEMNGTQISNAVGLGPVTGWSGIGVGDFNGDGMSDLLWTDGSGNYAIWEMNGTTVLNPNADYVGFVGSPWSVVGTGDFNGDGMSDILWTDGSGNYAIWEMNGTQLKNPNATAVGNVSAPWSVIRIGDFNGDGMSDLLWTDRSGNYVIWEMNGTTVINPSATYVGQVANPWSVIGTGDYNGDSKSDILWTDNSGNYAIWEMNGTTVLNPSATGVGHVATNWAVQLPLGQ